MKKTILNIAAIIAISTVSFIACDDTKPKVATPVGGSDSLITDSTQLKPTETPQVEPSAPVTEEPVKPTENTSEKTEIPAPAEAPVSGK